MGFLLLTWMHYQVCQAGLVMSPLVLKRELSDLKLMISIYPDGHVEKMISERSSIQRELFEFFHLDEVERNINLH